MATASNSGATIAQSPEKWAQSLATAALGNPDDLAAIQINDQGVELFTPTNVDLINRQALQPPGAADARNPSPA